MNQSKLDTIDQLVIRGLTIADACSVVGISRPTYYRWRRDARGEDATAENAETRSVAALLDAGEASFAEDGLSVSLREITRRAELSHSLILYHFDSKEQFIERIVRRRLDTFNAMRLDYLETVWNGKTRPKLADIVDAWMLPGLRAACSDDVNLARYTRIVGHVAQHADPTISGIAKRCFSDLHDQFISAFEAALPSKSRNEVLWRYTALTGLYLNLTQNSNRISRISSGDIELDDPDEAMKSMRPFLVAMMKG